MIEKVNNSRIRTKIVILIILLSQSLMVYSQGTKTKLPQFLLQEFHKGRVLLKNGNAKAADLNYNMVEGEMIFISNGVYYALDKINEIDTVFINSRKFIPAEEGFYELLLNMSTVSLYIQYKSKYTSAGTPTAYGLTSQVNDPTTFRTIRSGNQIRNVEVPDNVTVSSEIIFWISRNGEMKSFRTQKQFLKLFPGNEQQLKEYIQTNQINFSSPEMVKKLVEFAIN